MSNSQYSNFDNKIQPFYASQGDEEIIFEAAWKNKLPVLLKGPTGCGKTRFMEFMAWKLKRPLITVSCHDDLTASDLVGRYLIIGGETRWIDGPLSNAIRIGAICYLDEIVEARKDTTVVLHPLADDRRKLTIEKTGELLSATPDFCLTISYNPGYQSVLKDLKQSTRQRFVSITLGYPQETLEKNIVMHESNVSEETASQLIRFAQMTRNLQGDGLEEGASTRLLVNAAKLIRSGIKARVSCQRAIVESLTDDPDILKALTELCDALFID